MINVPFNRPSTTGNEFDYIPRAIAKKHISGDGHFMRRCHLLLQEVLGAPQALLTTSCTHALEMSALLLGLRLPLFNTRSPEQPERIVEAACGLHCT